MNRLAHARTSFAVRLVLAVALPATAFTALRPTPVLADGATTYTAGQSIEVREGDVWSAATVVRREGRRYLIHYANSDASTDEWVGTDRMRLPGTAGSPAPAPDSAANPPASDSTPAPADSTPAPTSHFRHPDRMFPLPVPVIPETVPDRTAIEAETASDVPAQWSVAPDPTAKPAALRTYSLRVHSGSNGLDVAQLLPCANGGAVIGYSNFGEKLRIVERLGTVAGSMRASIPTVSLPLAASPDGSLLVCRANAFGFGNNARIDAYTLTAGVTVATPLVSFTPYPSDDPNGNAEDISYAAALTEKRIVTCDGKGRLIAWELGRNSVAGVWRVDLGELHAFVGSNIALSPGGKWFACASENGITFVEAVTGRALGVIAIPAKTTYSSLSCSPTGKTLVALGPDRWLTTFDVATGAAQRLVAIPDIGFGPLLCVDDGFAMFGGGTLVATSTGGVVPQENKMEIQQMAVGGGLTMVANDSRLIFTHCPDSATRAAVLSAGDSVLALKPGTSVSVDIQLDMKDSDRAAVDAAIRKKLTDFGFVIAPSADTTVICRTEPGQQHEYHYGKSQMNMPIFLGGATSMILTNKVTRITIQQKGQTIWERKCDDGPAGSFFLKNGQSLEDGARDTILYNPQFLIGVVIPPYIAKPDAYKNLETAGRTPINALPQS